MAKRPTASEDQSGGASAVDVAATCPGKIKGAANDRIILANLAAYQTMTLIGKALDEDQGFITEEDHVRRALLSRAFTLSEAIQTLLVDDEVVEAVEKAEREVLHG